MDALPTNYAAVGCPPVQELKLWRRSGEILEEFLKERISLTAEPLASKMFRSRKAT